MRRTAENLNHRTAQRLVAAGMGLLLAGGTLIGFAASTGAASVTPTYYDGNQSCAALGYDEEFKINGAPSNGSYDLDVDGTSGTLTITDATSTQFSFSSTILVSGVFVKAADGGYLYDYLPGGTSADTGLYSPNTQGNEGDNQAAISHVSFCFGVGETGAEGLTIDKTVVPTFVRTYDWEVTKAVTAPASRQSSAATETFGYTVVANRLDGVDSDRAVSGVITISNPDERRVKITGITDTGCELDFNGESAGLGTMPSSIAGGGTVSVDYRCTLTSAATSNTATVQWTDPGSKEAKSASVVKPITWSNPTSEVDESASLSDLFTGLAAQDLTALASSTPTATGSSISADTTFTYSRTVNVPSSGCATWNNTVTLTEGDTKTARTDSESIEVCRATVIDSGGTIDVTIPPVTAVTIPTTTTTTRPPRTTTTTVPTTTVPPTTAPPVTAVTIPTTVPPTAAPTVAPVPPVVGVTTLAYTGDTSSELLVLGLILVASGILFLIGSYRRARFSQPA